MSASPETERLPADVLREAARRAGVSIHKGIQRDRHPDPEGLLVDALVDMGYIVAPVGEAFEEVVASSVALGAAQERDRLIAEGWHQHQHAFTWGNGPCPPETQCMGDACYATYGSLGSSDARVWPKGIVGPRS